MNAKWMPVAATLCLCAGGCASTYVAVSEHTTRPRKILPKAIDLDVQCLAFPFSALPALSGGIKNRGDAVFAFYIAGGVFAYGAVDFSVTFPGYLVYRTSRIATKAVDNFVNR